MSNTGTFNRAKLVQLRKKAGLEQKELAARVTRELRRRHGANHEISNWAISKYELGERQPRPHVFKAICKALKVSADELLITDPDEEVA